MITIRDKSGYVLYSITESGNRKVVMDKHGYVLGWMSENKTYDKHGFLIVNGESPGLLL
jgi:hypothetical protein